MIDRVEQLLRMHGYAKSDANDDIFYVKILGDDVKGIFLLKNQTREEAYKKVALGKEVLGQQAKILVLIFEEDGQVAWMESEPAFEEMKTPIAMVLDSAMASESVESKHKRFIPTVTIGLVIVNIILFLITIVTKDQLYQLGACSWQLVIRQHEWYRIFTSNYLHYGFDHLFNNMVVLLVLGFYMEEVLGRVRFFLLYTGAGLAGSAVSVGYYMMLQENVVSVGASGAIFGIVGALVVAAIKGKGRLQGIYGKGFVIMILGSLYHGISSAGIDNAAHVGGFFAGIVLAIILLFGQQEKLK